jgi:hypothetical protein
MTTIYGICGADGGFIQTARTERGAKNHATRNGYFEVYAMNDVSWVVWLVAEKHVEGWLTPDQVADLIHRENIKRGREMTANTEREARA